MLVVLFLTECLVQADSPRRFLGSCVLLTHPWVLLCVCCGISPQVVSLHGLQPNSAPGSSGYLVMDCKPFWKWGCFTFLRDLSKALWSCWLSATLSKSNCCNQPELSWGCPCRWQGCWQGGHPGDTTCGWLPAGGSWWGLTWELLHCSNGFCSLRLIQHLSDKPREARKPCFP